jgi:SAM-dependent methyltransferase
MIVVPALISDVAQRVLTLNKLEQRRYLLASLRPLALPAGARVLDFGCGTGLFAATLAGAGLRYCGYDPDAAAVRYAARRHPALTFVSRLEDAAAAAPYDIVLANCCFHHIDDEEVRRVTLPGIAALMHPGSRFLLVDVLPLEPGASTFRVLFNLLEQGDRKRTVDQHEALLTGRFVIRSRRIERFFVLSAAVAANPFYNDIVRFELALA